jgi:hypothetical protein
VQFIGHGFAGVAVEPDDEKLVRTDGGSSGKAPLRQVRVISFWPETPFI